MSGRLSVQGALPRTSTEWPRPATWVDLFFRVLDAIRTRRILSELDPRLLKDIGISRADAMREAARAPWELSPPHRRSLPR